MPKVSVIIPTLDRIQLLERALASVLAQSFRDFEVIIVQNGGLKTAHTVAERLRSLGHDVSCYFEADACPVNARNAGILRAKGEFIAFLDDDDEWLPQKLERQVAVLSERPQAALVFSPAWIVMEETGSVQPENLKMGETPEYADFILNGCPIKSLSAVMIRKNAIDRVGPLNLAFPIGNDYDLYLRLARDYETDMIAEPLYKYHCHSGNLSRKTHQTLQEQIRILRRLQPMPSKGVDAKMLRRAVSGFGRRYFALAAAAVDRKQYGRAAQFYFFAVWYSPRVGLQVNWSQFQNPVYRFLRPYAAAVLYSVYALIRKGEMA